MSRPDWNGSLPLGMSNPSGHGPDGTPGAVVRLEAVAPAEASRTAFELAGRLNLPNWPAVDIIASGTVISCRSQTWEPLLRVRIEEAVEAWLGHRWSETIGFI